MTLIDPWRFASDVSKPEASQSQQSAQKKSATIQNIQYCKETSELTAGGSGKLFAKVHVSFLLWGEVHINLLPGLQTTKNEII